MAKLVIVGAGMMGTAITYPLADNGHSVHLVGTHLDAEIIQSCKELNYHPRLKRTLPVGVIPYYVEEIAQAMRGADIIVSGVNSLGVHWIAQVIGPLLCPGQKIIAVTKGLETDSQGNLIILPDVIANELPEAISNRVKLAAIGGPCIAYELASRKQSCVVFGSRDAATAETLAAIFRTHYYHIFTTTDLVGLEYCAALKNAYAMAVGIAYGMLQNSGGADEIEPNGHNLAAAIFAQSCSEMGILLKIAGVNQAFALGLPGAGDLFVTTHGGRTSRLGKLLGVGYSLVEAQQIMINETLEAVEIIRSIYKAMPNLEQDGLLAPDGLPLMRALIDIIVHGKPVNLPLDKFTKYL